jgi:hypothetical protein
MLQRTLGSAFFHHFRDFAIALALFFVLIGPLAVGESGAFPAPPPAELVRPDDTKYAQLGVQAEVAAFKSSVAMADRAASSRDANFGLLAITFATLVAFNLFLLRHFRYVRAVEKRAAQRTATRPRIG